MGDIYEDVGFVVGEKWVMTHMLPRAFEAMQPWLREKVIDQRFWDGAYDTSHSGETDLIPMTAEERKGFWERYSKLPNPLAGKEVIVIEP